MFNADGLVQYSERMVFETRGDFPLEFVYFWSQVFSFKERPCVYVCVSLYLRVDRHFASTRLLSLSLKCGGLRNVFARSVKRVCYS